MYACIKMVDSHSASSIPTSMVSLNSHRIKSNFYSMKRRRKQESADVWSGDYTAHERIKSDSSCALTSTPSLTKPCTSARELLTVSSSWATVSNTRWLLKKANTTPTLGRKKKQTEEVVNIWQQGRNMPMGLREGRATDCFL